jgi:hypothetical protein
MHEAAQNLTTSKLLRVALHAARMFQLSFSVLVEFVWRWWMVWEIID